MPQEPARPDGWIDVHAHFSVPQTTAQIQAAHVQRNARCFLQDTPFRWTPEGALEYMDRSGIAMQMLSSIPKTADALRSANEYGASLVERHPARFGLLAALPTDDPGSCVAEIERAERSLRADGFAVTCVYNGVGLGDARLHPVWAELDRRRSTVFVHPDAYGPPSQGRPVALLEVAFETARTVVDMLYAGHLPPLAEYPLRARPLRRRPASSVRPHPAARCRAVGPESRTAHPGRDAGATLPLLPRHGGGRIGAFVASRPVADDLRPPGIRIGLRCPVLHRDVAGPEHRGDTGLLRPHAGTDRADWAQRAPAVPDGRGTPVPNRGWGVTVRRPGREEVRTLARDLNMSFDEDELDSFHALLLPACAAYDTLAAMPDGPPAVAYPRPPGRRPAPGEDPNNAWYMKAEVRGAAAGSLAGKTVALKDSICLAGVPMMNGSAILEGFVPDVDATVVTRILDAGGTILGKANCEAFCFSGNSYTNATGPTHNPHRRGVTSGGSSSGCAAAVAAGEADMAVGGDQGGSIRVPAAFCGIVGLKPTHGLVPYTGIISSEPTLDHAGPMTRTVADNALLLEVLAGRDSLHSRQGPSYSGGYVESLALGVEGLRIGLLHEGFGLANGEAGVNATVASAAQRFAVLGAVLEDISVPMHKSGPAIWRGIAAEGGLATMMASCDLPGNRGLRVDGLHQALGAWHGRADELPDSLKLSLLLGRYFAKAAHGAFYAKAQKLSRRLCAAYDEALSRVDLLLMPTAPMLPPPIPPADAPREVLIRRSGEALGNTMPFDCTGHPAMSVPCGTLDGLPVGMMLVARHHHEKTLYRAAAAFRSE